MPDPPATVHSYLGINAWRHGGGDALVRYRKREGGAGTVIRLCPETSMMALDDRAADRQPDTHAAALCRVESIEQPVGTLGSEPHAGIPHRQSHTIADLSGGFHQQLPRAILDTQHRVRGVAEQVQ